MNNATGANTGTWIAEDIPMYLIDGKNAPSTDEGYGMTAQREHGRNLSYTDALEMMAGKLREIADLEMIRRDRTEGFYRAAAQLFLSAADSVGGFYPVEFGLQIYGRFYRVRNVTA